MVFCAILQNSLYVTHLKKLQLKWSNSSLFKCQAGWESRVRKEKAKKLLLWSKQMWYSYSKAIPVRVGHKEMGRYLAAGWVPSGQPANGHTGLGTTALSDGGGWPPYFREEMTERKHATEQNKERNKGGKLGLSVLINTKTMARGIQWMGVLKEIHIHSVISGTCPKTLRSPAWLKK